MKLLKLQLPEGIVFCTPDNIHALEIRTSANEHNHPICEVIITWNINGSLITYRYETTHEQAQRFLIQIEQRTET